jgi:predicted AAA+ superfamily ATPase
MSDYTQVENQMLRRTIEKTILDISQNWAVLLLTGPRQVGKSSVLKMLKEPMRKLVSLDDIPTRNFAKTDPQAFLQQYAPPVIIDEIQYAPELFPYIKIWVDEHKYDYKFNDNKKANPNGAFWLTGSQKYSLMKGVRESLAGRVVIIDMLGLSQFEIAKKPEESRSFWPDNPASETTGKKTVIDVFADIWNGGFPELITTPKIGRENFYSSYMQTYIERDVKDYVGITNDIKFYKFVRAVAVRTGNLLNYDDLARDCEIDRRTAQKWLDTLQASGLIYLLPPYSPNIANRIIKTPKVYFLDTGLASYLANMDSPEALEASYLNGAMLETFVLTEILKSFWHNGANMRNLYFYRDNKQVEIDFIMEKNMVLYPIEVKKTTMPRSNEYQGFRVLQNLKKEIGPGAVVCLQPTRMPLSREVVSIPVWEI